MNRIVHGLVGVVLTPLLIAISLSGVVLAWHPLVTAASVDQSLSSLLLQIEQLETVTEVEQLERTKMGVVMLYHYVHGSLVKERIGPDGLTDIAKRGPIQETAQTLHRELFAGNSGRLIVGLIAGTMIVLCVTGLRLLRRRAGSWFAIIKPAKGTGAGRLHAIAGQLCLLPLVIVSATGVWMCLDTFGVIPSDLPRLGQTPSSTQVETHPAPSSLAIFQRPSSDIQSLTFPFEGDWFDVFVMQTASERIIIDRANGNILDRSALPWLYRISQLVYRLHSGEGLRIWAGVLGLSALAVPAFSMTGGLLWWKRRGKAGSQKPSELMIFVGSENGSTWDFARALAKAITQTGHTVGLTDLNNILSLGRTTQTALILTSTYGDGIGPQNASGAVSQIPQFTTKMRYAVLGFGDLQFSEFCAYAERIDTALNGAGHDRMLPLHKVNQQSQQVFADWAVLLGNALNLNLEKPIFKRAKKSCSVTLTETRQFSDQSGVTAVLRLRHNSRRLRYKPGDLIEITPPDASAPRSYSIAGNPKSATLDLVVREHPQGKCSPMLCNSQPGDKIRVVHKSHEFRKPPTKPVVMIATGTGIAPFIGMILQAKNQRMTLLWGLRNDECDFPFRDQLYAWHKVGVINFIPAFSRMLPSKRVPDLITTHSNSIYQDLIMYGGTTMICGSQRAAHDIRAALSDVIAGSGTTLEDLKSQKRHLEDVY